MASSVLDGASWPGAAKMAGASPPGLKGTISAATARAAGVLMTEAVRITPKAPGTTGPSTVA